MKNNGIIETTFVEDDAAKALNSSRAEAEQILQNEDKMEHFLQI